MAGYIAMRAGHVEKAVPPLRQGRLCLILSGSKPLSAATSPLTNSSTRWKPALCLRVVKSLTVWLMARSRWLPDSEFGLLQLENLARDAVLLRVVNGIVDDEPLRFGQRSRTAWH